MTIEVHGWSPPVDEKRQREYFDNLMRREGPKMPESTTFGAVDDDEPEMVSDYRKLLRPPPPANDRTSILSKIGYAMNKYRGRIAWFVLIPFTAYLTASFFFENIRHAYCVGLVFFLGGLISWAMGNLDKGSGKSNVQSNRD